MEEKMNVYVRARGIVQELRPVLEAVREKDKSLADQLKRAALHVASDWGYIDAQVAAHLDARLDRVCAITWCLSRKG